MGVPRHVPTERTRAEVSAYAAVGVPHHDIAALIGVSIKTLLKYYGTELRTGKAKANATVGKRLFQLATDGRNVAAAIFWMKAQAGWRERSDVGFPDGAPGAGTVTVYLPSNGRG